MTNLPATMVEAEATQYAREWVAKCLAEDWQHIGISMLDPAAGHIQLRQILKQLAMSHPFQMDALMRDARCGWRDAHEALGELIAEFAGRGDSLPPQLASYTIEILNPSAPPRGREKADQFLQDIAAATLVLELVLRFPPLKPTGRSARKASASKIVAAAFSEARVRVLTAKAVEAIWARYLPAIGDPRHFKYLPS
jgi:hypothetical protein